MVALVYVISHLLATVANLEDFTEGYKVPDAFKVTVVSDGQRPITAFIASDPESPQVNPSELSYRSIYIDAVTNTVSVQDVQYVLVTTRTFKL